MSNYWDEVKRESLIQEANETSSPERLRELAQEHIEVIAAVAKNPRTPLDVLEGFTQISDLRVLVSLIQNESFPEASFGKIERQPNRALPRILATNPRTPPAILKQLSQGNRGSTREKRETLIAVATNPRTPPEDLERLSNHPWVEVFTAAQKNLNNPLYIEGTPSRRWARGQLPVYEDPPRIPRVILDEMAQSENEAIRMAVARFLLPIELRNRLVRDSSARVRSLIARRITATDVSFEALAQDPSPLVRANLALNTNIEQSTREALARTLPSPESLQQDQLYSLEAELRVAFGRKTRAEKNQARWSGFLSFLVGAPMLFCWWILELNWLASIGLFLLAAFMVVGGLLLMFFPE
jgi:hypothetical protein